MSLKQPKIGVYGPKTRALQQSLSYEHVSLTWKTCNVYKYLGPRTETTPNTGDIQDAIFMETRDRAYDPAPVEINVWYEPFPEQQMDFAKFGVINPLGDEQTFKFHVNSFDATGLGRYIITGDVLEVPFLLQDGHKSYWEVTDVDRKTEFENFYIVVTAVTMDDKTETAEIPDKYEQDSIFQNIKAQADALADQQVPNEGITEGDVEVTDPTTVEPYDPIPEGDRDFLEDPNAEVF